MRIDFKHLLNYKILIPAVVIVAIVILGGGFYLYQTQRNQIKNDPQSAASEEMKKVVAEVGRLIELPVDENPTIETITDITRLQNQPFFLKAKNGNKVLIYLGAKKAILYDPVIKKVIDVAPVNIGTQSAEETKEENLPKVVLRNGTQTIGLTSKIESKLKGDGVKFKTATKENAQNQDYEKTVVVLINESSRDLAESIANVLEASISALPQDEQKADDADILVILGKDST